MHGSSVRPCSAGSKSIEVLEPRRRPYLALKGVGPRVIGADHPTVTGRGATGKQLVSPVAAHIGEGPEHAVLPAGQEHPGAPEGLGPLVTGLGHVLAEAHAHPPAVEEVPPLPVEDRGVDVGGAGKHAAVPEGQKRPLELGPVERGGFRRSLNDHTVNPMIQLVPRPASARADTQRDGSGACPRSKVNRHGTRVAPQPLPRARRRPGGDVHGGRWLVLDRQLRRYRR